MRREVAWRSVACLDSFSLVLTHPPSLDSLRRYLPGMMSPVLKFYSTMCILYACLAFIWFALYLLHWRDILMLQNCISAVIGLSMIEMAAWYFDYDRFNRTGYRPYNTTVIAALLGALRKSVSRMLLLVVAMGYGVVRPTLGGLQRKVGGLVWV